MSGTADFIDLLRLERHRQRLRQGDVAATVGVSQASLSLWESAHNVPYDEHLRAWAAALGVPVPEGVKGRTEAACGTATGYARHRRLGEPTCSACKRANADSVAAWRDRQRAS